MRHSPAPQVEPGVAKSGQRALFALCCILTCAAALGVYFRDFFASHLNLIAGDIGDNRLYIAILEHWRAVAHGRASFPSPNFFWPEPNVLGYSDAMFLLALPYSIARSFGLDQYISFELTLLFVKGTGFFGMLWLLFGPVGLSKPVALVGASLFTLSNAYYISAGHCQLMTVAFIPVLCALILTYWRAQGLGGTIRAGLYVSAAAILLGALFFTSFYVAWFTVIVGGVLLANALGVRYLSERWPPPAAEWIRAVRIRARTLAFGIALFALTMIPFIITYLPALKQTGGRSFQESLVFSPEPIDAINVGPSNWLWGRVFASTFIQLRKRFGAGEMETGWPFLTLFIFLTTTVAACWRCYRAKANCARSGKRHLSTASMGITAAVMWLASLKFGDHSLWWLVFKLVPGGSGIRVPARLPLVLNVLVVIVAAVAIEEITSRRNKRTRYACIMVGGIILITEHFNVAATHQIHRDEENAILAKVKRAPMECKSFLATNPVNGARNGVMQLDAMLVARELNIPTVNGYSGWVPPEWQLGRLDGNYLGNARHWIVSKRIEDGFCGCDLGTGAWSRIDARKAAQYELGTTIDFRTGGNAVGFEGQGWWTPESGGTWTVGDRSVLLLDVEPAPSTDLLLEVDGHAFAPPQRPPYTETVVFDNTAIAEWEITGPVIAKQVRVRRGLVSSSLIRIEFVNRDPKAPAEIGLSGDPRKLGLALHSLRLQMIPAKGSTIPFKTAHSVAFNGGNAAAPG